MLQAITILAVVVFIFGFKLQHISGDPPSTHRDDTADDAYACGLPPLPLYVECWPPPVGGRVETREGVGDKCWDNDANSKKPKHSRGHAYGHCK